MRKPIIAGNWKMYKTFAEAEEFRCTQLNEQQVRSEQGGCSYLCTCIIFSINLYKRQKEHLAHWCTNNALRKRRCFYR